MKKVQNWFKSTKPPGSRSSTPPNAGSADRPGDEQSTSRKSRRRFFTRASSATSSILYSTSTIPQLVGPKPNHAAQPPPPTAQHRPSTKDIVLDNASPIMTILKDGSEALKDIPYIKAIAGVTFTVLSIRKEIQDVDERTSELLGIAKRRSENLIQSLEDLTKSTGGCLGQLERHLEDYETFLKTVEVGMNEMKEAGSARRWLERVGNRDRIESHIRRMDEFDRIFTTSALSKILGLLLEKDRQLLSNPE